MTRLLEPVDFLHGPPMKNRFMLSPLTNCQSHPDGTLSDDEYRWLTLRAAGGFGLTMTCASHVQSRGRGFPGQLGCWSDAHVDGLARLAEGIHRHGSLAMVQLHHAGIRAPKEHIEGPPVGPSDHAETGSRALTEAEVAGVVEDFVLAALRAERAGYDGVELHGAHGYLIAQFLSPEYNRREDRYGGSPANRARLLHEILDGIRSRCRADFTVGVRLSPERFGLVLPEMVELARQLMAGGQVDFLDLSLWDVAKEPNEEAWQGRSLLSYFSGLERRGVRLGAAGKIYSAADAERALAAGLDFVVVGRAAVLHHDFPRRVEADPAFEMAALPVTPQYLAAEGLSPTFVEYMRNWKGFVTAP
jgi:2,4-dienoyl-CoA reductase-like NADH-dependent reductase (Old Yellow Enzyme family)